MWCFFVTRSFVCRRIMGCDGLQPADPPAAALCGIHAHQSTGAKASLVSNHLSINHHGNIPTRAQKLHNPLAFLCQSRPPRLSVRVLFESS
jgi:hypothetical protein